MKTSILLALSALSLLIGVAEARTWTSADGSKTFTGDFKSYNEAAREVTVVMKGFRKRVFKVDVLSEDDIQWLKEQSTKAEPQESAKLGNVKEDLDAQKIGAKLQKGVLVKCDGRRFAKYEMERAPEYYILYFSASW